MTSFTYLKRTVNSIEEWRAASPTSVIVYMDGKRVHNKTMKRTECPYDSTLIRSFFMNFCKIEGYNVEDLSFTEAGYGEAELLMYLNRDKSAELNVYVTRDTDMISICCQHVPTFISTNSSNKGSLPFKIANYRKVLTREKKTTSLADEPSDHLLEWEDHELEIEDDEDPCSIMNTSHKQIVDINATYDDEELKKNNLDVIDSCVWWVCGNSGSTVRTIGFDGCSERFGFSGKVFRTFFEFKVSNKYFP
ncbi:hypothetical protein BC332_34881 [Capsicum chinense]|nr:hypothetical protein BC332_34881 [Capsicum chinense]